jgi:hypothetical protein
MSGLWSIYRVKPNSLSSFPEPHLIPLSDLQCEMDDLNDEESSILMFFYLVSRTWLLVTEVSLSSSYPYRPVSLTRQQEVYVFFFA